MGEHKASKEKKPGKKLNLNQHKKTVLGGGLVVVIAIAGIITGFFLISGEDDPEVVFIWGTGGLTSIDPHTYGSRENFAILENIVESLFDYEFTAEGSNVVPSLALGGNWSVDKLNFTCYLRQDVKFHDGSPFNATAVKWNFDRIYILKDHLYWYYWLHPDGTPIINFTKTQVIDEYTIKFVLSKPFVPFEALLGNNPKIVSPLSTPYDNFSRFEIDKLVGTGPFKYDSSAVGYDPDLDEYFILNTTLSRNHNYWGEGPNFDKVIIKIFENTTLKGEALISGDIHGAEAYPFEPSVYENAGLNLINWTTREVNFISMNNSVVNKTMRKAISYALDYDLLVPLGREWSTGPQDVIRTRSRLSKGMLYSNWEDFDVPTLNITKARQVLIKANLPGTSGLTANDNVSTGNEWESLVYNGTPLAEYNFSYIVNWDFHRDMALLFQNNLTQIGINITVFPRTFWDHWFSVNEHQFLIYGWFPDYNDPTSNMAYYGDYFTNPSMVNDTYLQNLLENADQEYNKTLREQLYYEIQEYLIEDLYPEIWWYTPVSRVPFSPKVAGINTYNNWDLPFYEWYFS